MFSPTEYELLDFGHGRRLERFGPLVLDRPCPSAMGLPQRKSAIWTPDASFQEESQRHSKSLGERGVWIPLTEKGRYYFSSLDNSVSSTPWTIRYDTPSLVLELKGSPFGHLGVFPEQAGNWDYINHFCEKFQEQINRPARLLNLFAYTGGSTLAAAVAKAEVTHLDAAANIVQQAKQNAQLSLGSSETIRWIVDDAPKFVKRELKRENYYNGIILDPPTYGHGSRGEVWRFSRDFPRLLDNCLALLNRKSEGNESAFLLVTCHLTGLNSFALREMIQQAMHQKFSSEMVERIQVDSSSMTIRSQQGMLFPAGERVLLEFNEWK